MSTTSHLALTLVDSAQAQKEITVNTALCRIDAILNVGAKDKDLATPPGSPAAGDVYIVAASPTGAWAGQAKAIAYFDQSWKFIAPNEGMTLWVNDENLLYSYDGSAWATSNSFQNLPLLGVNATADTTNKLAVASSAVLFNNVGGGVQMKLNKNAASDTASTLYQTATSGRAEVGLCGDDNFHFKVSPDGSTWYDAIGIDKSTGNVTFNQQVNVARVLSAQNGGDANNSSSGSGAFHDHSLTYTVPANFLTANKLLRVTVGLSVTTGSSVPTLTTRLKLGSTAVYQQNGTGIPAASSTGMNLALAFYIQGTAVVGASAPVYSSVINGPNGINAAGNYSSVAQPVNLATNGTLVITFGTQWGSAGTGTNTITLSVSLSLRR